MSTQKEKDQQQQPATLRNQLVQAFWTVVSMILYVALGLILCYLKVMFGDMCRASNLNHTSFTDPENAFPVDQQETTPSLPYYCKEDSQQYVKQLFIGNPNFITAYAQFRGKTENGKVIPPTYTENETSQIFKAFFLETSYILFSITCVLQSIPDWLIILLHPIIWMVTLFGMSIFIWLVSSYNIFIYFLKSNGIFARWYVGWLAGFIAWFLLMCLWGAITVPLGVITGFGQLMILLSKQQVRMLDPLVAERGGLLTPVNESQYKSYSFSRYFLDMVKTSPIVHLMMLYTIYSIVEKMTQLVSVPFSQQFSYAFLAVIVLVLIWYRGHFSFIPKDKLNEAGWTSHVDPIPLPYKPPNIDTATLISRAKEVLASVPSLFKNTASSMVNTYKDLTSTAGVPFGQVIGVSSPGSTETVPGTIVPPSKTIG
jgi:hypothetical protein